MTTAQLVNLIVKKFGPGVRFDEIFDDAVAVYIWAAIVLNQYRIRIVSKRIKSGRQTHIPSG